MKHLKIKQGSTYKFPIQVKVGKKIVTDKDIKEIGFAFGSENNNLKKTYTAQTAEFKDNVFIVNLTEQDTLSIPYGEREYQIEVIFNDGMKKHTEREGITVERTLFHKKAEVTDNE